ncbi:MAG: hypothetical protein ACJ8FN_00380 [Sphingomicrobium sp.]
MVSTVKSPPNHYETLGVAPMASGEEIARAFARKMSVAGAHPVGEAAQILVAYETLRDVERRLEYDRSLAPAAKPETRQWTAAVQPRWSPFIASPAVQALQAATVVRAPEPHVTAEPAAQPKPELQPQPEPKDAPAAQTAVDPRLASIAATVRELAKPAALETPPVQISRPSDERRTARKDEDRLEPLIQHILEVGRAEKARLREDDNRRFEWRRPALAIGGLLLGAGLFGTLTGLSVKDNVQAAAESSEDVQRPAPRQHAGAAPLAPPAAAIAEAPVEHPAVAPPATTSRRLRSPPRPTTWAEETAAQLESGGLEAATEEVAAQSPQAMPAAMPLPNGFVARTIERIGYACGEVSSTARIEGEGPGVFKVTCTSGQSYRAAPVRGRYHFRRWGRS